MNFAFLTPDANPVSEFVLYRIGSDGRRVLRDEYRSLSCTGCGRVDEFAALRVGVADDVKIRSRKDFVATADWFISVSDRFREILEKERVVGAEFVAIPRASDRFILLPQLAPTEASKSGMKFIGTPCQTCGRYRESIYRPALSAMLIPPDLRSIFMPTVRPEKGTGRMTIAIASGEAARVLEATMITGIDWSASWA